MLSRRQLMNDEIVSEQINEPTILDKCKGSYFNGMNVYGKSTQVATKGYQLLNPEIKKINYFGIDMIFNDGIVSFKGTRDEQKPGIKPNLILMIKQYVKENKTIYAKSDNDNIIVDFHIITSSDKNLYVPKYTVVGDEKEINFRVIYGKEPVPSGTKIDATAKVMVTYDESAEWEPYTGGKPSPSPEYPQPINNVGGSDNLFPILEENLISVDGLKGVINSDGSITVTGTPNKQNAKVTKDISLNLPIGEYYINGGDTDTGNILFQLRITYNDGTPNSYPNKTTFLVTDKVASIDGFLIYTSRNLQPVNYTIYPMLNKGNKSLPFEKYVDNIEVDVSGGNLFPILEKNLVSDYGLKGVINSDSSITVTGTPKVKYSVCLLSKINLPFGNYYISGGEIGAGKVTSQIRFKNKGFQKYYSNSMITIDENISNIEVLIVNNSEDLQPVNYTIYPMLNVGSTPLPFEPYKPKQTLSLKTPNGLPGIPLSDENTDMDITPTYVDKDGKRWVCDEIDLGRGKYVQRVKEINPADYDNWILDNATDPIRFNINIENTINERKRFEILSDRFIFGSNNVHRAGVSFTYSNKLYFYLPSTVTTVEEAKQWFIDNPTTLMYMLGTPVERDLTQEEITAYKQLHTYTGNTTIINNANADISIKYRKYKKTLTKQEKLEKDIKDFYAKKRNGKVYQTKIWKFATNPTSTGEKLRDNAGLVFTPSTDTSEGQDDYLNGQHPLFEWVNVNYVRDDDGTARPIAIEGMDNYKTSGSVDVGVMQMNFYWNWDSSNPQYDLVTISDSPHPELGLKPWPECVKADGTILPWCIGSKYVSGIASDGLLRSQPNLKPERNQSHNNMITNYQKKGKGYWGAGISRNLFQILFNVIKGATKNSQSLYNGVTDWNFQYDASIQRENKETYFPVTNAQANNLTIGNYVSVGYGYDKNGVLDKDRGSTNIHKYADNVKILKIEKLDDNNKAVYLDVKEGFNTTPVKITETLTSPIILSSMHSYSGKTDSVLGKHDGSPINNQNGKYPYRVQGREYAVGGYILASDTVMELQSDYTKKVYFAKKGIAHTTSDSAIKSTYKEIGKIPAPLENNADWWIGDISVDVNTGVWYPSVLGTSGEQGWSDRVYAGGTTTSGMREYLQGGGLGAGSGAGSAPLDCGAALSSGWWYLLGCD